MLPRGRAWPFSEANPVRSKPKQRLLRPIKNKNGEEFEARNTEPYPITVIRILRTDTR
jgi:hypothetical protein